MGLIRRFAILGAAGAGVAWFLKQRQEQSEPALGGASAGGGDGQSAASDATNGQVSESELTSRADEVGDSAAAGTGTAPEPAAQETTISKTVEPPEGSVTPDTTSDPLVREQENAAAAEAGAIGGTPETPASDEGLAEDPAMKPVVEASGEEPETLEATDDDLGAGRERQG